MTRGKCGFYSGRVATDPFFASVKLLLHMNGTGSTFIDSSLSAKSVTPSGQAVQVDSPSVFGRACKTDLSGSLVVSGGDDFNLGSGNFTIEGFFWPSTLPTSGFLYFFQHDGFLLYLFRTSGINYVDFRFGSGLARAAYTTSTSSFTHFAGVRSGSVLSLYANGVRVATSAVGSVPALSSNPLRLARATVGTILSDEIRVTKGVARYTGNSFGVPSSQFLDS
jgi:hypothetical protein